MHATKEFRTGNSPDATGA